MSRQQLEVQASFCEMQVDDLMKDLILKCDEVHRCQDMLDRISLYDADYQVPKEVVDFINHYTRTTIIVSKEDNDFLSKAGEVLKNVIAAIWNAIKWICEKLVAIFRYLFDRNYRAAKGALDLQRRVIVLQTNPEIVNKFENLSCNVVARDDINSVIMRTRSLITLMGDAAKLSRIEHVDTLINNFAESAAVKVDIARNQVSDDMPAIQQMMTTTFGVAGWTFSGYLETINTYADMVRRIEGLREIEKATKKDVAKLQKQAEDAQLGKVPVADINALQAEVAAKIAMTKILGFSIAICIRRSDNVLSFLNAIYQEMHKLAE